MLPADGQVHYHGVHQQHPHHLHLLSLIGDACVLTNTTNLSSYFIHGNVITTLCVDNSFFSMSITFYHALALNQKLVQFITKNLSEIVNSKMCL